MRIWKGCEGQGGCRLWRKGPEGVQEGCNGPGSLGEAVWAGEMVWGGLQGAVGGGAGQQVSTGVAGDGVLLRALRDSHVPGVHGGGAAGAPGPPHCAAA